MPRHSPCALSCFNFSPVCLHTLLIHTLIAWASQIGFFYSIVVHPFLFEKTFQSLSQIFIFLFLSVFTLPWELFFPYFSCARFAFLLFDFQRTLPFGLVGSSGFEPPTLRLSGARSNHLSYEPLHPVFLCSIPLSWVTAVFWLRFPHLSSFDTSFSRLFIFRFILS